MPELQPGRRLDQPLIGRRRLEVDPDGFARLSERIARFLGTGRFLAIQSVIVVFWIALNLLAWQIRWDPYPFILLNLAFSTQAAYAAPLILLAQNRQDDRDRIALEEDRRRAERTKADTEYLARELASLRLAVGEMAGRDYLRGELDKLSGQIQAAIREGRGDAPAEVGADGRGADRPGGDSRSRSGDSRTRSGDSRSRAGDPRSDGRRRENGRPDRRFRGPASG